MIIELLDERLEGINLSFRVIFIYNQINKFNINKSNSFFKT